MALWFRADFTASTRNLGLRYEIRFISSPVRFPIPFGIIVTISRIYTFQLLEVTLVARCLLALASELWIVLAVHKQQLQVPESSERRYSLSLHDNSSTLFSGHFGGWNWAREEQMLFPRLGSVLRIWNLTVSRLRFLICMAGLRLSVFMRRKPTCPSIAEHS